MRTLSLICAISAVLAGALSAQRLPDSDVPPPPPTGLSDEDGVLANIPGSRQRITGVIRSLESQHGYRLYVIIINALVSTAPGDFACRLQQEWLPNGGGLVIVFESDTKEIAFGRGLAASEGMIEDVSGVPAYVLLENISKAVESAKPKQNTDEYLETLVVEVGKTLQDYFRRKKAPVENARSLRLGLVTIGVLSFLALCGMGIGWLMGKSETQRAERRRFPAVDTPERLSAPYSGGGGGYAQFTPRGG